MFNLKYLYLIFLLLFGSTLTNYGQNENNSKLIRLEIETKQDSEPFYIIPFGNNGVVIFYESVANTDDRDHRIWIFKLYDVNLKQTWVQELAGSAPGKSHDQFSIFPSD